MPERIFEGAEGILTSEHSRLLLIGNPTSTGGTFYNSFREPGWHTIAISAFDTPNFTAYDITQEDIAKGIWEQKITGPLPNPKLITPAWVADKYRRWGPTHPAYESRILGQFASQGDRAIIPLAWIEAAMARWEDTPEGEPTELGVDPARYGDDDSVIATRKGHKVLPLQVFSKQGTMETTGYIVQSRRDYEASLIKVDVIGLGAGIVDRLLELGMPVVGINVAEQPIDTERFNNKRSELWWNLRELLDPDKRINPEPIALPPDDELLADLSGAQYEVNSKGQTVSEPKEKMKKRIGRSPDRADATILVFAPVACGSDWEPTTDAVTSGSGYDGPF